jgi:asparagine synthetase B (glutamine-hydrolysing)
VNAGSRLSELDVACGLVFGEAEGAPGLPPPASPPRQALEDAVRDALLRPPCLVSFSGGRDSAAVLAVASHVARRDGLNAPIPATNVFPEVAASDEAEWQERVIRHLDLDDWERVVLRDELDCVGPVAREALTRHGLLWPFNAFFHVPLLRRAAGGSLLTGVSGDEAFSRSQWARTRLLLAGAARPQPRDVLRVGMALAPRRLRAAVLRRRFPEDVFPWLRNEARRSVEGAATAEAAREPLRWSRRLEWMRRLRHTEVGLASLDTIASGEEVVAHHPLSDRRFWAALAALPRSGRFESRTDAMRLFFGDLLPDGVLARTTKASFDEAFWNRHSRAFAASWQGQGVDTQVVDVEALRREWLSEAPNPRSYLLVQAAWLAGASSGRARDDLEQRVSGAVEPVPVRRSPELPGR